MKTGIFGRQVEAEGRPREGGPGHIFWSFSNFFFLKQAFSFSSLPFFSLVWENERGEQKREEVERKKAAFKKKN